MNLRRRTAPPVLDDVARRCWNVEIYCAEMTEAQVDALFDRMPWRRRMSTPVADVWRDYQAQYADLHAWIASCPAELKHYSIHTKDGRFLAGDDFTDAYEQLSNAR